MRLASAETVALDRSIRVPGVVRFDESRWTDVTLDWRATSGIFYVDRTGQAVRRGQPLFTVYSPELATALAEYRLAVKSQPASLPASAPDEARRRPHASSTRRGSG